MAHWFQRFRRPSPVKIRDDEDILAFALHANGRVDAIKQGSGLYGMGLGTGDFGAGAFSETAFGVNVALSQSTLGWSAAYTVSTWVYRCIEVRKSAVHRMPWAIINKRTKERVTDHPLEIAIRRNQQRIFKKIEQSQLLYGETFIELAENPWGYRSDLYWLNNNGMAVLVGAGRIVGYAYMAMQGGTPKNLEVEDVAFMKTDNPFNDLRGLSPTEVIMDEVAIDKDVARVVRAYYANDTRVGILLIPKTALTPADSERFMAIWKEQHQGPNKAGKPVLMPYDMTVERVQEPATLDDVQLRESTRREIAAAYGVPLSMAGGWDDAKYQSLPEQRKSFYEETIIPECDNIAEFINASIMPHFDDSGQCEFKYDYMQIMAMTEDAQRKNDIYSNRLVSGMITRAEARAALGHPVTEADEVYYVPATVTVVPVNQLPPANPPMPPQMPPGAPTGGAPQTPPPTPLQTSNQPTQKPQLPATPAPRQLPQPGARPVQPAQPKSVVSAQSTPEAELAAWEKKALNHGAIKATRFEASLLPVEIQTIVRGGLLAAGKDANKATIRTVFAAARKAWGAADNNATKYEDQPRAENGRLTFGKKPGSESSDKPDGPKTPDSPDAGHRGSESTTPQEHDDTARKPKELDWAHWKNVTRITTVPPDSDIGRKFSEELKNKTGFSVEDFLTAAGVAEIPTDKFGNLTARVLPTYRYSGALPIPGTATSVQRVTVWVQNPENHNAAPDLLRTFHFDEQGKPTVVENEHFYMPKDQTGTGLGTKVFASQVDKAAKMGFKRIDTIGGRSEEMNGYYTWPRLGYDGMVKGPDGQPTRLTDLMRTKEGRDYWKQNGVQMKMSFDLSENSRSRKILDAYVKERFGGK
jgi:HK97 family phage portal protein